MMKPLALTLILVTASAIGASPAAAADTATPSRAESAAPTVVSGVKLSTLCSDCAVVSAQRSETREGEASAVGTVGGAVVGGLLGNQVGGGHGKTAMTVLGAVGGGVAGREIEKTVKKHEVWITTVTFKDGTTKTFEAASNPGLRAGDIVRIENGAPVRQ